ncbi:MAG: hypothetical protein Kow0092_12980 [Deferrisomatales bacterium]
MKRVLAFIASPRKLGNSEILAKEIARHVPEPHELRLLRLSDFDLRPCRGCYACLFSEEGCVIQDDLAAVCAEILAADAYIVAAPAYLLGPPAVLKRLMDRWLSLYPHAETLWGRPAVGVTVAGVRGREGYTPLGVESFLKLLYADIKATRVLYGALPGEVFYDPANRQAAARLGRALFGEREEEPGPACPVCGGRTFRFLGAGRVRCMLCSNEGSIAGDDGNLQLQVETGEHEFFTSLEAAVAHREWLKGMKGRFLEERGRLKEITRPYLDEGTWVRPK